NGTAAKAPGTALAAQAARTLPAASGGRQRPARGLHPGRPGRGSPARQPLQTPPRLPKWQSQPAKNQKPDLATLSRCLPVKARRQQAVTEQRGVRASPSGRPARRSGGGERLDAPPAADARTVAPARPGRRGPARIIQTPRGKAAAQGRPARLSRNT